MPSVYKRVSGDCVVYYAILYDNGRAVRRSTGCSEKADAMKKAAEQQRMLDRGQLEVRQALGHMPPEEAWKLYYAWAIRRKLEKTIEHEQGFWDQFWAWHKGTNLCAVTPESVLKWRDHLARTRTKQGAVRSPRTINGALGAIATIIARLMAMGHVQTNPFSTSETPRLPVPKRRPKYLTQQEVQRVLVVAQHYSTDAYLFTALGLYAGLRKAEILNLRWKDVQDDRQDEAGNVVGCLYIWEDATHRLKTAAASRVVPLHPILKGILAPHRDSDPERYVVRPRSPHIKSSGYRWDPRKAFMEMASEIGHPVTPHMLRHTFASLLAAQGVSLYKVSKWMGHESITTTEIYAHLCPVDAEIGRL